MKKKSKTKKKAKIEFKPNPHTIVHDPHDYNYAIVVTNPGACRKTKEEMSR